MVAGEKAVGAMQAYLRLKRYILPSGIAREALQAALPFLPVQGAVKKLAWNEYEDEQGNPDRWDAEASSFGVFYSIEIQHDGYRVVFDHEAVGAIGVFDTLDAAKAAAQADFEARILSALEPSAARELALEEALRKMVALYESEYDADVPFKRPDWLVAALSSPDHIADAGKLVEGDGLQSSAISNLIDAAKEEAAKAMRKFPQPNYVISKIAEEAGEVVKAAIHCAEGRENPEAVIAEIKQTFAMLFRLLLEGDEVHGLSPLLPSAPSQEVAGS